MNTFLYILIGVVITVVCWMIRRQRSLKLRAHLMQEAIRNRDFTFRLPTDGLLPGERAMQETLNQLGETIRQQMNRNEVESWERLTRVLTHEIMNATAPIASISQSMLDRNDVKGTPLEEGIRAIQATSQHLNIFVDSYRKLSLVAEPKIETVGLFTLISDIRQLYPDITWDMGNIAGDATVDADAGMLHQVLINLVKNALEAGARRIALSYDAEHRMLLVSNDGEPIPAEAIQSIFVPFFTTKRTGSGIGLSLSRRMMVGVGGNLSLPDHPVAGYHVTFALSFSK